MTRELRIGELAKAGAVNIQTLRYYERRRLLVPVRRRDSGYRVYGEDAAQRLRFIKNAQALGFSLEEIRSLLQLRSGPSVSCERVRGKALAHAREVKERIERLRAIERVLRKLVVTCQRRGRSEECPILKSLEAPK